MGFPLSLGVGKLKAVQQLDIFSGSRCAWEPVCLGAGVHGSLCAGGKILFRELVPRFTAHRNTGKIRRRVGAAVLQGRASELKQLFRSGGPVCRGAWGV